MSIAKQELEALDIDVLDVLNDYGAEELYIKPFKRDAQDDIYNEIQFTEYETPVQVKGLVKVEVPEPENIGTGRKADNAQYTVKILKSSYPKTLTRKDVLVYLGEELQIEFINKYGVIGDDFLMYNVEAKPIHGK